MFPSLNKAKPEDKGEIIEAPGRFPPPSNHCQILKGFFERMIAF